MKTKISKILLLILLITNMLPTQVLANTEENQNEVIVEEQKEMFGINSFIKNAKEYSGEFFAEIDLQEMLNSAIKGEMDNTSIYQKIFNLLGEEVKIGIKSLISILVIVIIHSILKSISENLENKELSKIIYYVQYIAIVTIIMTNFSDIIAIVRDTATNLVGFMNSLIPILISLMLYTGSITTSSVLEPIILFMVNLIGNLIQNFLIPSVLIVTTLSIISQIGDKVQINKLAKFFNSGIVWLLGVILTIFVGIISLEGTLSSSVDGITAKTTKAIVSSSIPIVGKILGDAVDSVLGCGIILKNAIGVIGVIIIIGICIMPIIKIAILTISYKVLAGICEPIADEKIIKLLDQIGNIFKVLLAILCSMSVMVIIGTTLVIKISNSGMMYR